MEEKEANIAVVALLSGSLLFKTKKQKLLETVALFSFSTIKYANALTPIMISQDETVFLPPTKKLAAVSHFLHKIDAVSLEGKSNVLENLSQKIHARIKKKSLIILIGDFLGEVDLRLLAKKHDLFVLIIRDRFEENPSALGYGEYHDPESSEKAHFYFGKSAKEAYATRYKENDKALFSHCNMLNIAYDKVVI